MCCVATLRRRSGDPTGALVFVLCFFPPTRHIMPNPAVAVDLHRVRAEIAGRRLQGVAEGAEGRGRDGIEGAQKGEGRKKEEEGWAGMAGNRPTAAHRAAAQVFFTFSLPLSGHRVVLPKADGRLPSPHTSGNFWRIAARVSCGDSSEALWRLFGGAWRPYGGARFVFVFFSHPPPPALPSRRRPPAWTHLPVFQSWWDASGSLVRAHPPVRRPVASTSRRTTFFQPRAPPSRWFLPFASCRHGR